MHSLRVLAAIALLFTILRSASWTGRAIGITDGDTVRLILDGCEVKIHLQGIDAPEQGQSFCACAKHYLSPLTFGKDLRADILDTARYGHQVALLYLPDGCSLDNELVRHCFAWWYSQYATDDTVLARLEREANERALGLWGNKNPIPPWEWRRDKPVSMAGAPPVEPFAVKTLERGEGRATDGGQGAVSQEVVYRTRMGAKYYRAGSRYL